MGQSRPGAHHRRREGNPAKPLAQVSFRPWLGTGITELLSANAPRSEGPDIDEGENHADAGDPQQVAWTLTIDLLSGKETVLSRTVQVKGERGSVTGSY